MNLLMCPVAFMAMWKVPPIERNRISIISRRVNSTE